MRPVHKQDIEIIRIIECEDEQVITVHVEVTCWATPAKVSGPPEDCYPEEPMEWDYTTIPTGIELLDEEKEEVVMKIEKDEEEEDDYPFEDDYYFERDEY